MNKIQIEQVPGDLDENFEKPSGSNLGLKKINKIIDGHLPPVSTSRGSAAFFIKTCGVAFSGAGVYEDDQFTVAITKDGALQLDKNPEKKKYIGGSNITVHQSVLDYHGGCFFC